MGDSLPAVERLITQDRIERYAAASGDLNPVHLDAEYAASTRFGGTIAHGMMVAATISEAMTTAFGRDWLDAGGMKLRFRSPVFPGDTVTAGGEVKSVRPEDGRTKVVCSVAVRKQDGVDAITGDAWVTITGDR